MTFRDNLQYLRGTRTMSQAELAQELGVSRQSVAKWEAEKSYPEIDKLIKLCDLFGCSLDDLVRGDLTGAAVEECPQVELAAEDAPVAEASRVVADAEPSRAVAEAQSPRVVDEHGYDEHMRVRAWDTAAAVAVLIASIGVDFFITGGHMAGSLPASCAVYLVGIAIALALTMPMYRNHVAFQQAHPHIEDFYPPARKAEAAHRKVSGVVVGIVLAVLGLGSPALFVNFHTMQFGSLTLFGFLGLAAGVVVYAVMMEHRVEVLRYNAAAQKVLEASDDVDQLADLVGLAQRLRNAVLVELRR